MEKLLITSMVLDKLGFSEYWDENCDWGGRTLKFKNGTQFRIMEICEIDDDGYGYSSSGKYISNHYTFSGWFAIPKIDDDHELFFIHDMYWCIKKYYPECVDEFVEKLKKFKMYSYVQ